MSKRLTEAGARAYSPSAGTPGARAAAPPPRGWRSPRGRPSRRPLPAQPSSSHSCLREETAGPRRTSLSLCFLFPTLGARLRPPAHWPRGEEGPGGACPAGPRRGRLGQARGQHQRGRPRALPQAWGSRRPPAHGTGCPCVQAPRRQTPPGCGARGAPRLPSQHALHLPPPAQGHHPTGGRCDHRHFTDEKN